MLNRTQLAYVLRSLGLNASLSYMYLATHAVYFNSSMNCYTLLYSVNSDRVIDLCILSILTYGSITV